MFKLNYKKYILAVIVLFAFVVFLSYLLFLFPNTNSKLTNSKKFPLLSENVLNFISPSPANQAQMKKASIESASDITSDDVPNEIKMLYPTKEGGRTWEAKWSTGGARNIKSGERDPFDAEFIARGNGSVSIDGNGIAQIKGGSPRMYVYDRKEQKKWKNVEVTVYAKRISESKEVSYQGIVIGARSEHQDATLKKPCKGATYYGRLLYDGRAVFQKEVIHEGLYSSNKPKESNKVAWDTADGTMPKDLWIGLKLVVKNSPNNKTVNLELYRDLTNGYNGGTWEKVAEYTDRGNWSQAKSGVSVKKKCGYSAKKILLKRATSVFIRNDYVNGMQYKAFSIREID